MIDWHLQFYRATRFKYHRRSGTLNFQHYARIICKSPGLFCISINSSLYSQHFRLNKHNHGNISTKAKSFLIKIPVILLNIPRNTAVHSANLGDKQIFPQCTHNHQLRISTYDLQDIHLMRGHIKSLEINLTQWIVNQMTDYCLSLVRLINELSSEINHFLDHERSWTAKLNKFTLILWHNPFHERCLTCEPCVNIYRVESVYRMCNHLSPENKQSLVYICIYR